MSMSTSLVEDVFAARRGCPGTPAISNVDELLGEVYQLLMHSLRVQARYSWSEPDSDDNPWRRKAKGLPETLEVYWHDFWDREILWDRGWPGPCEISVEIGLIVDRFSKFLVDRQRAAKRARDGSFGVAGRNLDDIRRGLLSGARSYDELLEQQSSAVQKHYMDASSGAALTAFKPEFDLEPHTRTAAADAERVAFERRFYALAEPFLESNAKRHPWLAVLIETLVAPVYLDGKEPVENIVAANALRRAPSSITGYVQRAGVPALKSNEGVAGWRQTLIGRWVTRDCEVSDPKVDKPTVAIALAALSSCNRNRLGK